MIKIDRTSTPNPSGLKEKGEEDLIRLRKIDPAILVSKDFKRTIYGSFKVKTALWKMQHGKCCFCEQEMERKHSDVEHFRPKAEAQRENGIKDTGYWWLAYHFDNLYFGCRVCNTNKGTHFPLKAGASALIAESDPRTVPEESLLIDPGFEDPEEHLTFVWSSGRIEIVPVGRSEKGRITKEILVLDRDDLTALRQKYYKIVLSPLLVRFNRARDQGDKVAEAEIREQAQALAGADSRFSLLARIALRGILETL